MKKYLVLLRQAQNEALVTLIGEGLEKELEKEPLRATNAIMEYLTKDILRGTGSVENSDFTRV